MEGQWVFGGDEEDSRKSFILTVEDKVKNLVAYSRMNRTRQHHSERLLESILELVQVRIHPQDSEPLGRIYKSRRIGRSRYDTKKQEGD